MNISEKIKENAASEVDAVLDEWRSRAVTLILGVGILVSLPVLLVVLSGYVFQLALPLRAICLLLFFMILSAVLLPRWQLRWRVVTILTVFAGFGMIQLAVAELAGSGRITLLAAPLVALALGGPRTGWIMAFCSVALYVGVALLRHTILPISLLISEGIEDTPVYWIMQGLMFLSVLLMLLVLLSQFQALQRRTMISEHLALMRSEEETAKRQHLEREVARIGEKERQHLGSELHDGLCQNLTAALLQCSALELRQSVHGTPLAVELTRIREMIEGAIDVAHHVARDLCPVNTAPENLAASLEKLCGEVRERWGICCQLQVERNLTEENPEIALQLFRSASEALTNAAKHSGCSFVMVELACHNENIVLRVMDDGKGIEENNEVGLGQRIMAYRAGLVGGAITVSGEFGKGTEVICRIPHRKRLLE